jgi:hypothetical protein
MMRSRTLRLLLLLGLPLAGCGARSNVIDAREDGTHDDMALDGRRDAPTDTRPRDQAKKKDKFVWPDQPKKDHWPWPDTYAPPTPFGCQIDSDCFGIKCCPTPWGVKLCRNECDQP